MPHNQTQCWCWYDTSAIIPHLPNSSPFMAYFVAVLKIGETISKRETAFDCSKNKRRAYMMCALLSGWTTTKDSNKQHNMSSHNRSKQVLPKRHHTARALMSNFFLFKDLNR